MKTNKKRQSGGKGGKDNKGDWGCSGGQKGKVQIISGDFHQEVATGMVMVVISGVNKVGENLQNPTNTVRSPRVNRGRNPSSLLLCGEKHIVKNCP